MRFERYVAIGDSTTQGMMDPDGAGGYRGWANRFAEHLARGPGTIQYANLAISGTSAREIHEGQLAAAVALAPDVATVVAGMNDLLRRRFDAEEVVGHLHAMIQTLTRAGAVVLTFTLPDITGVMPLARVVRHRLMALNALMRVRCVEAGARLVDLAAHGIGTDRRVWHEDRLHANALGHERVAMGLAHAIGLPGFGGWSDALPEVPAPTLGQALQAELTWGRQYLVPWLFGRAQGDTRSAKRPTLAPFSAAPPERSP